VASLFTHIECAECGHQQVADTMAATCLACGSSWLDARYNYAAVAQRWVNGTSLRDTSLWRYADLLPIAAADPEISMLEGNTPLLRLYPYERLYDHTPIFIKDERQGPTSSFKDRQAALAVTALKQVGIRECVLASSGNAGAAYSAYCARAGIKLWLFVSEAVPDEKLREAALYGAEVVRVTGSYDEAKRIAAEFARRKDLHLDRGARAIPGKESMKTLAFEIAEQLGLAFDTAQGKWRCPDWYIQAVSGGIGPLGVWKGFTELYQMGLTDRLPKLGIIQVAGCAPMVRAFAQDSANAAPITPNTLIHVLATGDPGFSYVQLRQAVLEQGGTMLSVEDGEAFAAMRRLASNAGLSVEPATAVAFAGLEKMLYDGIIDTDEVVVVNCSGHTFPAESHVLGDQYLLNLKLAQPNGAYLDGLEAALRSLDEQVITILIVDDNPVERQLMQRMLKRHKHYRVFEAKSGKEALRLTAEHKPNLIVADLMMPEMDGLTLIEQLKWNPDTAYIPIVVVSAKTLTESDNSLLERYSVSVWQKSDLDYKALVQHVATLVNGKG
jgi:threonine synthase